MLSEILFITTYPPRECGIATYSQDLITALNKKFHESFKILICPLESKNETHSYHEPINYFLNIDHAEAFPKLLKKINENPAIKMVMIQHEFGLFEKKESEFNLFLAKLTKPLILVFHTVLPHPDVALKAKVKQLSKYAEAIVVMTNSSSRILIKDYKISPDKISIIAHGTHLVPHADKEKLKEKFQLNGKKVLATFGLLSSGKGIETTLNALPQVVKQFPETCFLIIGKTHPAVANAEGEKYRNYLAAKVKELNLEQNVKFINCFLPLPDLLSYLQLTDIYSFTSKDPNQAVSGTFSYAISCGCPVISTPIPHAQEVLKNDAGIIIDFDNPIQLTEAIIRLLSDDALRNNMGSNGLHHMASTAWENSAIAHAMLFEKMDSAGMALKYTVPEINLNHFKKMTTDFGMIQFSKLNQPDSCSGYTIDDNARALIAMCQHYELTKDQTDLTYIRIYFDFIKHCIQDKGYFLNYVDEEGGFTKQNFETNLDDANGRAIWALGYLISNGDSFPASFKEIVVAAQTLLDKALTNIEKIHSTRAMAFVIKGLYYVNSVQVNVPQVKLTRKLANRLVQMYRHEAVTSWHWYEAYLTYANSLLPEAMLCAFLVTDDLVYKEIAKESFDFLLLKTFHENAIKIISNKGWLHKKESLQLLEMNNLHIGGEQPIDVAYTIIALRKFYEVFKDPAYLNKIEIAFNWFLGNNNLHRIIYNPCTGGCYDGLEENNVNLNQGAESTVSYLMARLAVEKVLKTKQGSSNYYLLPPPKKIMDSENISMLVECA